MSAVVAHNHLVLGHHVALDSCAALQCHCQRIQIWIRQHGMLAQGQLPHMVCAARSYQFQMLGLVEEQHTHLHMNTHLCNTKML